MARDFDDFVGTLSDGDVSDEENEEEAEEVAVEVAAPSGRNKKRKREAQEQQNGAAAKKPRDDKDNNNDGDLESDFEFENEDAAGFEELDAWAANGVEAAVKPGDIDAIIARRRPKAVEPAEDEEEDTGEEFEELEYNENEDEDEDEEFYTAIEGLSETSESQNSSEAGEKQEADDDDDDDDDEIRKHVPHPDDLGDEVGSDEEDAVETEKRNTFFANDPETNQAKSSATAFHTMNLSRPILKGLAAVGFSKPTPIQAKAIPVALEGKDLVGGAVTGSGKTAAFLIPILERLLFRPKRTPTTRVAILMPTRELALQCFNVAKKLASFTDIKFGQAIGGLNLREQEKQLKLRPDIVIATPGRFIDLERNSASFAVDTIEILVLDEADRMLEEGFADELNEILNKIPKSRQTMLFSATMTSKVDDLIRVGLQRPVRLLVDAQKQTVSGLVQEFVRLRAGREGKRLAYLMHLCERLYTDRVIIFFRQKKDAHRVRVIFALCGMKAAELHGNMSQEQRIEAIEAFRTGRAAFLLATDLASRGLDIKGIETVINYEAPQSHEIYLHRVGRTARAGRSGRSCTLAAEPDRKVVKAAVKAGKAQGAQIRQRTIDAQDVDAWQTRLDVLQEEVDDVLREEKEERALQQVDRDLSRADNIVKYEDEIKARPKKTWFESEKDKQAAKEKGNALLNGQSETRAKKEKKKLSNKDRKRLQDKDDRRSGMEWRKNKTATLAGKADGERKKAKSKGGGKAKGDRKKPSGRK